MSTTSDTRSADHRSADPRSADTSSLVVDRFRDALVELERSSTADALVDLYADSCTVGNVASGERFRGREGARDFWTTYRERFGDVRSEFSVVVQGDGGAVLEWTTNATIDESDVSYRGATVLEIERDSVTRSMAYFDPSDLGRQLDDTHPDSSATDTDTSAARTDTSAPEPDTSAARPGWSGPAPGDRSAPEAASRKNGSTDE